MRASSASRARRVLVPRDIGGPPLAPFGTRTCLATLAGRSMGTNWRVRLVSHEPGAPEAHRGAVEALLATLVGDLSNWEPGSALSRFNRSPRGAWQPLPSPLIEVLVAARAVHRSSAGAFDPTVGPAVAAWGFGPRHAASATDARAGFGAVELDLERSRARRCADVSLDLCGIAKGYAVDRISRLLTTCGAPHHLVEIGGELRGNGVKPDGMPWWVALEAPPDANRGDDGPVIAALHGLSIATSGDYRHWFGSDGVRYAHTIDPRTGRPVADAPASVTVLHANCMEADAQATAITVLGAREGLAYATAEGLAARVIVRTPRGLVTQVTPAFAAMLA